MDFVFTIFDCTAHGKMDTKGSGCKSSIISGNTGAVFDTKYHYTVVCVEECSMFYGVFCAWHAFAVSVGKQKRKESKYFTGTGRKKRMDQEVSVYRTRNDRRLPTVLDASVGGLVRL